MSFRFLDLKKTKPRATATDKTEVKFLKAKRRKADSEKVLKKTKTEEKNGTTYNTFKRQQAWTPSNTPYSTISSFPKIRPKN